jgi:hypothetical protein
VRYQKSEFCRYASVRAPDASGAAWKTAIDPGGSFAINFSRCAAKNSGAFAGGADAGRARSEIESASSIEPP